MNARRFTDPLPLKDVMVRGGFFGGFQKTVLDNVIPYQWEALNDRVPDAAGSFCISNFEIAAGLKQGAHRGCVFQDSDLAKWLESVAYALALRDDPELMRTADGVIDLIVAAQMDDGYLNTYYIINGPEKRFTNLRDNHELYCFGHMLEAAVAYYETTGKDKLLKAMIRYADLIDSLFGPEEGKLHGYPGHEVAEMALIRLYGITGNPRHLALARYFITERGRSPLYFEEEGKKSGASFYWRDTNFRYQYYQAGRPVTRQHDAEGHAVRAMYLMSGIIDVARCTGDETLYDTALELWQSVTRRRMYVTGAVGSSPVGESFTFDYDLPNDTVYGETCAAIGLAFFARRLLFMSPRAQYADVLERALYNGILSGMSLDGRRFFYVNPLEVVPEATQKDEQKRHVKVERQKWFGCACCPPNLARILTSLGQYMVSVSADTAFFHLYESADIRLTLNGQPLSVSLRSGLPWDGAVTLLIESGEASGTLAMRIPGWCRDYTLRVNGETTDAPVRDGYALISGHWQKGSQVELTLSMPVTVIAADPRVRENIGRVAVTRGPLVYCLEEKDNGDALHLVSLPHDAAFTVRHDPDLLGGVDVITAKGYRDDTEWPADSLYAPFAARQPKETALTFIPYYAWANRGAGEMRVWVREG